MLAQRGVAMGGRSGAGPLCCGQYRDASERSQLGALPLTAGSSVSVLCPVWSLNRRRCGGLAGLTVVLTSGISHSY